MAILDEEISMNCSHCQAPLSDTARFCTGCGSAVTRPDTLGNHPSEAATQYINAYPGAAPVDPLIGCILEDKYQITALLGEGGMGAVYRATRVRIGAEVAVTVLQAK